LGEIIACGKAYEGETAMLTSMYEVNNSTAGIGKYDDGEQILLHYASVAIVAEMTDILKHLSNACRDCGAQLNAKKGCDNCQNWQNATSRPSKTFVYQQDAPDCCDCGEKMVRNGACYKCLNCGASSGCS
jgi:hypothetical protein